MRARDLINDAKTDLALAIAEGEYSREGLTKVFQKLKKAEQILTKEVKLSELTELQRRIIMEIEHYNELGEHVYKPKIAERVGYARTTVSHAIAQLLECEALEIEETITVDGCKHYKYRVSALS